MRRERLGHSDVAVTEFGLGTAQLGDLYRPSSVAEAHEIVEAAWRGGVRHFDTAPLYGYGLAESRLGAAIRELDRSEFTLSSKVGRVLTPKAGDSDFRWDFSARGVRESLEQSLERLGTTYLDVGLIHDPQGHVDWAIDEALPALEELKDEGLVRAIGVGSGVVDVHLAFAETGRLDVLMVAGRYTLLEQPAAERLFPLCAAQGISILNVGVFNSGLLAAESPGSESHYDYATASPELVDRARELAELARSHGTTLPQAALAFAAAPAIVAAVVVGAESAQQVERNLQLFRDRTAASALLDRIMKPTVHGTYR